MKRTRPEYESDSESYSSSSSSSCSASNSTTKTDLPRQSIHRDLARLPDALIQREWRNTIEKSLVNFIQRSPLKNISDNLGPDFYVNMSPFLVREVMRMANALCGVHVALHVTLETMEDICRDAVHRLLDSQTNDLKTKQSITLLCESLPMPTVISERQLREDETLKNHMPLQIQHVIENDRHRAWLTQYKQAGATTINVFTVKMGPGTEKATPETGRYIVSMLMPIVTPMYRLTAAHEPHANSYEEIDAAYTRALIELDSHKRMLKQCQGGSLPLSKHTLHEEAMILAGQLQDKRVVELKRQCDQQRIQIGVLTNTVQEMVGVLHSEEQQNSMKETVLVLIDKLKQSRHRNYGLIRCLKQKDADQSSKMTFQKHGEKKRKIQHNRDSYSEDCTYTRSESEYSSSSGGSSSGTSSHREDEEEEDESESQ